LTGSVGKRLMLKNAAYPKAIAALKANGTLPEAVELRQVKDLNNIVEQDHRFIKRRVKPGLGFFSNMCWAGGAPTKTPLRESGSKSYPGWLHNPERSSGDIFRELQRRSPGRYQPLQIRTLQRGMRKIRAHLLETLEKQWQAEVISGPSPRPVSSAARPTRIS